MALVLGAGAYCEWLEAADILAVLGFSEGQARSLAAQGVSQEALATPQSLLVTEAEQLAALSHMLSEHPQRRVILLYADLPLALMAITAQSQHSVQDALAVWQEHLNQLQTFYRRHREQTLLFELGQVLKHPQQFLQVCAAEWQQALPSVLPEFQVMPLVADSELTALASQLPQEEFELSQQLQYLRAMTWPLGDGAVKAELVVLSAYDLLERRQLQNRIQEDLRQLTEQKQQLEKELAQSKQERENIGERLAALQNNLELAEQAKKKSQEEAKQLIVQISTLNSKHQSEQKALQQENDMILDNLFKTQEELERIFLQEKLVVEQKQQLEKELAQSKQERENIGERLAALQKDLELAEQAKKKSQEESRQLEKTKKELGSSHSKQQDLRKELERSNAEALKVRKEALLEKENLEKENQELLENLLDTQEKLSHYRLKEKGLEISSQQLEQKGIFTGLQEKRAKRKKLRKDKERAEFIAKSTLFDADWYLAQYPDVADDKIQSRSPALHYLRIGGFEGRNPSPNFDSAFYLESNLDVAQMKMNPLWHYLRHGQMENRLPLPEGKRP